jgi:acyl-coenzyme A thioesterase PaaI-like protein
MKMKALQVKWMMNLFPPLFFNRIRIVKITPDFKQVNVRVRSSLLNRNLQRTIFGGTIFSAADPYYAIMYWQIFAHEGMKTEAWLKEARIEFLKPAASHLDLHFELSSTDIETAKAELRANGKFSRWHEVEAKSKTGEVVARIHTLVYLRIPGTKSISAS